MVNKTIEEQVDDAVAVWIAQRPQLKIDDEMRQAMIAEVREATLLYRFFCKMLEFDAINRAMFLICSTFINDEIVLFTPTIERSCCCR